MMLRAILSWPSLWAMSSAVLLSRLRMEELEPSFVSYSVPCQGSRTNSNEFWIIFWITNSGSDPRETVSDGQGYSGGGSYQGGHPGPGLVLLEIKLKQWGWLWSMLWYRMMFRNTHKLSLYRFTVSPKSKTFPVLSHLRRYSMLF